MAKSERYRHSVSGFGKNPGDAIKDARENLPYDINSSEHYKRIEQREPVKVEDGYKVDIRYTFAKGVKFPAAEQAKSKSGSAGPGAIAVSIDDLI